jgi:hypothetical protein
VLSVAFCLFLAQVLSRSASGIIAITSFSLLPPLMSFSMRSRSNRKTANAL